MSLSREELEQQYGEVWDRKGLTDGFVVLEFRSPHLIVQRFSNDFKGTLEYQKSPEFYFNFKTFNRYRKATTAEPPTKE